MMLRRHWILLPLLAGTCVALTGCPGPGAGDTTGPTSTEGDTDTTNGSGDGDGDVGDGDGDGDVGDGDGDGDSGDGDADADPATRLRKLVGEVVALAESANCRVFGKRLVAWTDSHRREFESLIRKLKSTETKAELAELDAFVEEHGLKVLEAAAECDTDDAWPAWEHFEAAVDQARK